MKVLVVIVTYNGRPWLERCLGSVYGKDGTDVYVWDNDSTDGSADFVAARYPQAKLVRSAENLGFSIPNNKGMEYALQKGYDYVYLLNQDAWLEPGALEKLVAAAEAHPEYGVLSPLQYTADGVSLDSQFAKRVKLPIGSALSPTPSCPASTGHLREVSFVMAAHWLVPTRVIRRIGSFEEELFPFWGQDDDWCHVLHFFGLKIGVLITARGVHDRACREEPLVKLVRRNYYTGSLVRLCNVNSPLLINFLFIILFTLVKAAKYHSTLPFKYFRTICQDLPKVRKRRLNVRARARYAQ